MSVGRRGAAAIVCALAVLVLVWWVMLYSSEPARALFVRPDDWERFRPFVYADAGLAVLTLVAGIRGFSRGVSPALAGVVVGAWGYATLWSVGSTLTGAFPALGAVLMGVALGIVAVACHGLVSPGRADHR